MVDFGKLLEKQRAERTLNSIWLKAKEHRIPEIFWKLKLKELGITREPETHTSGRLLHLDEWVNTMYEYEVTKCKSCGASITYWLTEYGAEHGIIRRIPVDSHPNNQGNVVIRGGLAHVIGKDEKPLDTDGNIWMCHFVTCPQAGQWRTR